MTIVGVIMLFILLTIFLLLPHHIAQELYFHCIIFDFRISSFDYSLWPNGGCEMRHLYFCFEYYS